LWTDLDPVIAMPPKREQEIGESGLGFPSAPPSGPSTRLAKMPKPVVPKELPEEPYLFVEVYGLQDLGKTHYAETFPSPVHIDTEYKAWIVMRKFNNPNWFPAKTFDDIRNTIHYAIENPEIKTVCIDSSADLRELAEEEWRQEQKKPDARPVVIVEGKAIPFPYREIYQKIDSLFRLVMEAHKNLVLTARMKPGYEDGEPTGDPVRAGYKKVPYQSMIQLQLEKGLLDKDGNRVLEDYVCGKVVKNNYLGPFDGQKPYLIDVSYEGTLKELLKPWWGSWDDLIQEAKEFIEKKQKTRSKMGL